MCGEEGDKVTPEERAELLTTTTKFGSHLDPKVASQLIELARSDERQDVDDLIKVAMTRELRHPRIAIEAITSEFGQRFAKESVHLAERSVKAAQQSVKVARWAAVAAGLAALGTFGQVLVAIVTAKRLRQ
jgi:hypothetical protein